MMQVRETVLITGASTGIGYELAKLFAKAGDRLILVARSTDKLNRLAEEVKREHNATVKVITKDLSNPHAPWEIYSELQNEGITVDILVNNAGFGVWGFFKDTELARELEMLQLNIVSLTHLTKLFLKGMLERKRGKIMNVASTAAFQPGPLMAVYYASKAYVLSFSEAISNELKGTGVTVSCLCPGHTETEFQSTAKIGRIRIVRAGIMDAQSVAKIGYDGLMKDRSLVIAGFQNNFFAFLSKIMPRQIVIRAVRTLQER